MDFQKYKNLPISFTVKNEYSNKDTRFLEIVIDVLHTGKNFNGSVFDKDIVDKNIKTINNTPILGFIKVDEDEETDDFTKHEYKLVKKDGDYKYVYMGSSYGVIPESCNPRWIYKVSSDGQTREYLQVDALLWTKFDKAIEIFERDIIKNQSMELEESSIRGYEDENNIFHFTDFKFDGCCILSTTDPNIQPAMIDSTAIANFNTQTIADEIKQKLNEYSTILQNQNTDSIEPEFDINKFSQEGGNAKLDKKLELISKYELTIEALNFSIDDISLEDLEIKLKEFKAEDGKSSEEPKIEPETDFALNGQFVEELIEKLSTEKIESEWGSYSKYSYIDFDSEKSEVYCWDRSDWKLYGFSFSKAGDTAGIDFESKKRKKFAIEDFVEGVDKDFSMDLSKDIVNGVIAAKNTAFTTLQTEFETYKSTYQTPEIEVEDLRVFKSNTLTKQYDKAVEDVFMQFEEKLNGNEEFEALKADTGELSLEQISDKCFSILGKKDFKFTSNIQKPGAVVKLPVSTAKTEYEPYGGLHSKYGIQPKE